MLPFVILFAFLNLNHQISNDLNTTNSEIKGYQLLTDLSGHWIGTNETAFGPFQWFAFDFRPISPSHLHSIYEGATNQNIITSIFIADFEGKQQIMARNGGWLGSQYRATYFVLDQAKINGSNRYYRLVDAVGREKRAYMEFRFEGEVLYFDAYKDNSGALDEPIHHMGFEGKNVNPSFAKTATTHFNFPQVASEVDLNGKFSNLIDEDSALFLEEKDDPFPRSQHGYLSELNISIHRNPAIEYDRLLLYLSTEPLIDSNQQVQFDVLNTKVIRTIDIQSDESNYQCTYLHPATYYITIFSDKDANYYPSKGDWVHLSQKVLIPAEQEVEMEVRVDQLLK